MRKKFIIQLIFIMFIYMNACSQSHHRGLSFITNPDFDDFAASLTVDRESLMIQSYFQSSIIGRTEYIYENFDITIPKNLERNKKYDVTSYSIRYAKGGQGGQIATEKAEGCFIIKKITHNSVDLEMDVEFKNFAMKGQYPDVPSKLKRKGILSAKIGNKIY